MRKDERLKIGAQPEKIVGRLKRTAGWQPYSAASPFNTGSAAIARSSSYE